MQILKKEDWNPAFWNQVGQNYISIIDYGSLRRNFHNFIDLRNRDN